MVAIDTRIDALTHIFWERFLIQTPDGFEQRIQFAVIVFVLDELLMCLGFDMLLYIALCIRWTLLVRRLCYGLTSW